MNPYARPFHWDDLAFLCDNMRNEDIEECRAGGFSPFGALTHSIETSIICKTLVCPGSDQPGAVLGICPGISPTWGAIWLLGTDSIKQHRIPFLRLSRQTLASLYEEAGREVFYNYTYVENHVHHAWLRWLGFTFIRKTPFPPHGLQFYEFVKIKG